MFLKYGNDKRLLFTGAIFDEVKINALRTFCKLYFHGHSVGGTNPSLLEAMGSGRLIAAHDNEFNRAILQSDAFYFSSAEQVAQILNKALRTEQTEVMLENNFKKIQRN